MSDMHYLGQMESMTFLHVRCGECKTPVFASVALTNEEGELKACDIATNQMDLEETPAQPELNFSQKQLDPSPAPSPTTIPIEDLTAENLLAAATLPVSYDLVLDTHEYLDQFSGDFESLLGQA